MVIYPVHNQLLDLLEHESVPQRLEMVELLGSVFAPTIMARLQKTKKKEITDTSAESPKNLTPAVVQPQQEPVSGFDISSWVSESCILGHPSILSLIHPFFLIHPFRSCSRDS